MKIHARPEMSLLYASLGRHSSNTRRRWLQKFTSLLSKPRTVLWFRWNRPPVGVQPRPSKCQTCKIAFWAFARSNRAHRDALFHTLNQQPWESFLASILRPLLHVNIPIVIGKNDQKFAKIPLGAKILTKKLLPLQPPPPFCPLPGGPRSPPKGAPGTPREGARKNRAFSCTQCKCSTLLLFFYLLAAGAKFFF